MWYECEITNKDGQIVARKMVEISVGTPDSALSHPTIKGMKQRAKDMNCTFRVSKKE